MSAPVRSGEPDGCMTWLSTSRTTPGGSAGDVGLPPGGDLGDEREQDRREGDDPDGGVGERVRLLVADQGRGDDGPEDAAEAPAHEHQPVDRAGVLDAEEVTGRRRHRAERAAV